MSRDPQLMLEGVDRRSTGAILTEAGLSVRRRLLAARYLDAAHAQARTGHAQGLSREKSAHGPSKRGRPSPWTGDLARSPDARSVGLLVRRDFDDAPGACRRVHVMAAAARGTAL